MKTKLVACMILTAITSGHAYAAPDVSAVRVTIGPDLAKKTEIMDKREFDYLTSELKRTVEKTLDKSGALRPDGGELDLVIEDARPNRPTLRQMSGQSGLSYSSFGVGGARITGEYHAKSGERVPVDYSWYETDITRAPYSSTWSDADTAFDRLADKLARNEFKGR